MIGKYKIEVTKRDVKFELVVDRQITVITGDLYRELVEYVDISG